MEQRRCHRIKVSLDATLREEKEDKFPSSGAILDMSGMGLSITSKKLFDVGQKLYVEFEIPGEKEITVATQVVWYRNVFLKGHPPNQYGLKILDSMEADEKEFLKYFVKQFLKVRT